jgi:hypothetical protein
VTGMSKEDETNRVCNTHGAGVVCTPNKILILITYLWKRQIYYDSIVGSITNILIHVHCILIFNFEGFQKFYMCIGVITSIILRNDPKYRRLFMWFKPTIVNFFL